jgi:tetratricopeptide (TPR) repeat protein
LLKNRNKRDESRHKKKGNSAASEKDTQKKQYPIWFNLILLLIPVLMFTLLEISLRIFNYGKDTSQWIEIVPGELMLNPDIAHRYFHSTASVPYSNQNSFSKIKSNAAFRVFIVGGSSAAGYPYSPKGDFGLYIKKKLEILYPESEVEIINVALTATNSYTIRDLIPGIIEQKPDLILFYAGHNEYYGALGVGSMESIGQSRSVVNFVLSLEQFKSFVFLRDMINWIINAFSGDETDTSEKRSGTLMSRMAKDQTIALNSEVFNLGLEQLNGNLADILEMCRDNNIPIILGTLTSNLRNQRPFISIESDDLEKADDIFNLATTKLDSTEEALRLFRYAKDLDGLRFRAPEKINQIIKELAKKYNSPYVDIDSIFNSVSPYGITGDNLMTDHLHPTFDGYKLIGKIYFEGMEKFSLLPSSNRISLDKNIVDSLTNQNTFISKLDSIIAHYRILVLKNDWPYSEPKSVAYMLKLFNQQNIIDTLAVKVLDNRYSWERAHREAAEYYAKTQDYDEFIREMTILINQYPFVNEYYTFVTEQLLEVKLFDEAYSFLVKGNKRFPGAFFTKWLGIIDLSKDKTDSAIKYLTESLSYNGNDAQVLFNLTGAYAKKKMFNEALNTINRCLSINPNYPGAQNLKNQLAAILNN